MQVRNRVKELRRVRASELRPHPSNWRTHPDDQRTAMGAVLEEVGFAGALLAYEDDGRLVLIDGHLRRDLASDAEVPVLVTDLTEEEARKVLATYDPLGAMAEANTQALGELLAGLEAESDGLRAMLEGLAEDILIEEGENDPEEEWQGMPEFVHEDKTAFQSIHVHFAVLMGQKITPRTRAMWYPEAEIERYADKRYVES